MNKEALTSLINSLPNPGKLKDVSLHIQYHQPIDPSHTAIWVLGILFVACAIIAVAIATYSVIESRTDARASYARLRDGRAEATPKVSA